MNVNIRHLVITIHEEKYHRIIIFQDTEGNYLTMNIENYYD